jgi:hypothetical protein
VRQQEISIEPQDFGDKLNAFFDPWVRNYYSFVKLNSEAQQVVGLRMARLALGGRQAEIESQRMISEKLVTMVEAQISLITDIATGRADLAPARAIALFQRRVSANRRRLS